MDKFEEYIADIKSQKGSEVRKIIEAADNLLYLMFDSLDFSVELVDQIEKISINGVRSSSNTSKVAFRPPICGMIITSSLPLNSLYNSLTG